ncbi:MAG TPA: ShlB/FhaC/HecB family hemolysin secretion/activation protein [Ramlibacter sp.]|uniref:ShlB/FhaC/HecB family hemolysin secretion/activation protein n=1 Tax=Ramlibacter sp. TaxID=1917967 RepID=UPI002ED62B66
MKRRFVPPRAPRPALLALAAAAAATVAGAQAPAVPSLPRSMPPMAAPAASPVFAIRGFRVEGENPLGDAATQRVLAPFVRPDATLRTLQQATAALEEALRDHGFGLHRVALPPQEVGATVRLQVVKFAIGKVGVEGASFYDEGNVRRTLPELREGESPNFRTLAIQTAIANENPNKQVQVRLRESEEPDRIDATVTVKEKRPWTVGATLSNLGSKATGRDRFTVALGHTNLFNRDHQFVGAYTTSLERPGDVKQLGLSYKVPLYAQGGVLGATYVRSDVVGNFGAFDVTGAGHSLGLNYLLYLPPKGGRRSYVNFAIQDKVFDRLLVSGVAATMDRRSRPVTVGYTARTETDDAAWGYNVELAWNTGSGANNDLASYRSEDPRIDTVHWKAVRGLAAYTAPFARTWLWTVRGAFQASPDALIAGERYGLGGIGSIRGTEVERPISGDSGASGTMELSTPELSPGLRLHGFVDAGVLRNHNADGLGRPGSDAIASVGVGLRFERGPISAGADYGYVVDGSKVPLTVNSFAPKRGDDRFYITLTVKY